MKLTNECILWNVMDFEHELEELTNMVNKVFSKLGYTNQKTKVLYYSSKESPILKSDQIEIVSGDFFVQFMTDSQKHLLVEDGSYVYYSVFSCVAMGRTNPSTWKNIKTDDNNVAVDAAESLFLDCLFS